MTELARMLLDGGDLGSEAVVVDVASAGVAGVPPTPTQVRFQVIAPAPTSTELDLGVVHSSRKVTIPRTLNVAVVK